MVDVTAATDDAREVTTQSSDEVPTASRSLVGTTIDGFAIDAVLGGGAFGTVYRGRQLGLDRPVALKVPTQEIAADPVMARRFAREARAAARITHPGVVSIYAVGELPDGRPYLAMELIEGEPLHAILADGPVATLRALKIVRQIATALADTHAADVVHRDLKPSNIVWRRDRHGDDRITLVDFGIAVCKPGTAEATRLTAGGLIGTPHYMSPEQAHGEVVDGRADLYALGCVLFELLTGVTPFEGSSFEVMLAHLGRTPPVPSERNPDVPERVDGVVAHLLAKRPDDRPQSADAVVALLDKAIGTLEGRIVVESSPPQVRAKRKTALTTRDKPLPKAPPLRPPTARTSRSSSRWVIGAVLGILGLSAGGFAAVRWTHGPAAAVAAASEDEPVDSPLAPVKDDGPGRRSLPASDGSFTANVLVPDPIAAGDPVGLHIEIWNKLGAALAASELVVTIEDPHGLAKGYTAHAHGHDAGHYGLTHRFAEAGRYVVRIFPPDSDSELELAVDVK